MSKKHDLKLVFDFIAEYLKDEKEQPKGVKTKELLIEDKEPKFNPSNLDDVINKTMKTPIDNVGADAAHIKQLMERVEAKTVEKATINNLLATQRKEFEQEIKKLKEKASEDLKTEKVKDENIDSSGSTESIISNDDIESAITNNLVTERILGKR
jgi:phenylalanyl-tRNA synthetase alpha subunit